MQNPFETLLREIRQDGPIWVTGAFLKRLLRACLRDRALIPPSIGSEVPSPDGKGRWFVVDNGGGGSASAPEHPFQLVDASVDGLVKIRVRYGTVGGALPSGMSPGDDPPYVLTVGSGGYIYLVVTADLVSGAVTSCTIGHGGSIPSDTATTFHQEIGSWSIDVDDVLHIAQNITSSLEFELCGGVEPLFYRL